MPMPAAVQHLTIKTVADDRLQWVRCFERTFTSQCLVILAEIMEARKPQYAQAVTQCLAIEGSFTAGLYQLLQIILTKFMVLSSEDFELWESDPAQFVFEDLSTSFMYKLNVCANALPTMLSTYRVSE
jgi:hypothetical protein